MSSETVVRTTFVCDFCGHRTIVESVVPDYVETCEECGQSVDTILNQRVISLPAFGDDEDEEDAGGGV